ncbi:MAG: hypothetical protein JNK15_00745 [Planctomycetes bacterium]|nr:hypothetical protein [Planctomycetota bacterium]
MIPTLSFWSKAAFALAPAALALSSSALQLSAQCVQPSGVPVVLFPLSPIWTLADEGRTAPLPLGFAFPIGGNTYSHVSIETNGVVYLTNGGAPVGATIAGTQSMDGGPGGSPRIAVCWSDLDGVNPNSTILMDSSVPGECKVTWYDVNEYGQTSGFTFQVVLRTTGEVALAMPPGLQMVTHSHVVGVSAGNGVTGGAADLSTGPTSTTPYLHQSFSYSTPFDLDNRTTTFSPNGGGYAVSTTCVGAPVAHHAPYGAGCYQVTASFYEYSGYLSDLGGSGMTLQFTPSGYDVVPATTSYQAVPPTATVLPFVDDDEVAVPLGGTFVHPGGSTTTLVVCSNGFVSSGFGNGVGHQPRIAEFLSRPAAMWCGSWHDYLPAAGGSVTFHQTGSLVCFTWADVFSFGAPVFVPRDSFQMQFDLATGDVHVVWITLAGFGNSYLMGYAPAGPLADPGVTDLSVAIPATFHVPATEVRRLTLRALQAPISTPSAGSGVLYTTDDMPEFAPGVYLGMLAFSGSQVTAPGFDLGTIGAPGCAAFVGSLDVTFLLFGATPSQTETVYIPPGVPIGTTVYSQSIALFPPGALANGQNPLGIVTSNGLSSFVSIQ